MGVLPFWLVRVLQRSVAGCSRIPFLFDGLRWGLEGGFRQHRALLQKHFDRRGIAVLDCGCGTGIHAGHFSSAAYVGIDISEGYLARARRRYPNHRFELMDAQRLSFENGSFDAVIVSGVIHHMEDERASEVLHQIARVLKPKGLMLLWEDIPIQGRANWVGRWVQALDVGDFIRHPSKYLLLVENWFVVDSIEMFRSGFMEYVAFRCRPRVDRWVQV